MPRKVSRNLCKRIFIFAKQQIHIKTPTNAIDTRPPEPMNFYAESDFAAHELNKLKVARFSSA